MELVPPQEAPVAGVVIAEERAHGPVPVPGHHPACAVTHDVVGEHLGVVPAGLDEQDVDLRVLGLIPLQPVLHAAVQHDAQGLVEDIGDAVVAQVTLEAATRGPVQDGDDGVDADDKVRPVPNGKVDVGGLLDPPVHVVAVPDAHRAVEAGEGGGGLHRSGNGDAVPFLPEGHRFSAVQVHRHHVELPGQAGEGVRVVTALEELMQVFLETGGLHETGGEQLEEREREIGDAPPFAGEGGQERFLENAGSPSRPLQELRDAQAVEGRGRDPEGAPGSGGDLLVHLGGRYAAGQQGGDESPPAYPHVEIEVHDAAVQELV